MQGGVTSVPIDVGQILDEGRLGRQQRLFVFLAALTIVFDGIDNQLLGIAIPAMMRDWALPRAAFAPILAGGMIGMMVGGAIAGIMGDPLGRTLAGLVAGQLLPTLGWRTLFTLGGMLSLGVSLLLMRFLPESPRYLVRRPERWPELRQTLNRIGHPVAPDATFVDSGERS